MKLLLVGTYPRNNQHSLIGFAHALRSGLPAHGIETRLITPRVLAGRLERCAPRRARKWLGHLDTLALFPAQLRRAAAWADVVHLVDHGLAVYTRHLQGMPHVVTCNDLIALRAARGELPEWSPTSSMGVFQRLVVEGLDRAQHVACISHATRDDVCRLTRVPQARTTVVYDCLFHPYTPTPADEKRERLARLGLGETPFLMHIGRDVPTKNRSGVLQIFAAARRDPALKEFHLVMAGHPLGLERHWIAEHGLEGTVHEMSPLDTSDLRALYSGAGALIFPSFYEGFGLPILEAQACGCLVFTSDRAPMTEVGGRGAVYIDPAQPQSAAQVVAQTLRSPERVRDMVQKGFDNLERFTPDHLLAQYAGLYRCLQEQCGSQPQDAEMVGGRQVSQ